MQSISQQMVEGINIPGWKKPVQMEDSMLPSYWTKWVDRPGVRAKWTIFFQSPKGTRFTNKAQIKKYFEKFQISYSSELFDFELDENVTKLHKIWKKFIFKNKSDSTSTAVSKNLQEIVKSLALCTIFTILLTFLVMHICIHASSVYY